MSAASRLSNALQGSSTRRLLLVAGVLGIAAVAYFFFSTGSTPITPSQLRNLPSGADTVQGRLPVSPEMDNELSVADQQRIDAAKETGGSAMPTIRALPSDNANLADADPAEKPVDIPRPTAPIIQRPAVTPTQIPAPIASPRAVDAPPINLAEAMASIALPTYPAARVEYFSDGKIESAAAPAPQQAAAQSAGLSGADLIDVPLPGTIIYAQMISEANSDSPGPILAQIVQGPLAGAKLIGQFSTQRDTLVISFSSMTVGTTRDGQTIDASVPIQAYAVDSSTIGTGVATDVDYHLLENIGITFAASFAQGFGQAIAQSGQQIVQNDGGTTIINPTLSTQQQLAVATGTAAGAAGESLSELFGNRPVTVKVRSGTGIGVLFLGNGRN